MKVKTADLIGPALDWAVAIITKPEWTDEDRWYNTIGYVDCGEPDDEPYSPSSDWSDGGPTIEREHLEVSPTFNNTAWVAVYPNNPTSKQYWWDGPTPLVAAMRCFVASKLGDEVDIPEELLT